jgi:serine protease Do
MIPVAIHPCSGRLHSDLEAAADRLRRITVQIHGSGYGDGCGVIWRPDGLIVSNAHVARRNRLEIELWDGRLFSARLRWRDPQRDLAVLGISAIGLTAAVPADVSALRPGEIVLALGHPFGLANALALGVVHQAGNTAPNRWLRADIRLAPGNSGGPLANAAGEVLGINTLVAAGLAHAIPVTAVQDLLRDLDERAA